MKEVKMYKCSDNALFEDKEDARKHQARLDLEEEVNNFLNVALSKAADHSKSAKREVLMLLWPALEDYFTHKSNPAAAAPVMEEQEEGE